MSCCLNNNTSPFDILSHLLANTYVLLVKTQNVHWNIKGENFGYIHSLTEAHYEELFNAIDTIAERIRMIGLTPPAKMSEFLKMSCISEEINGQNSKEMLKSLLEDHKTIASGVQKALSSLGNSDDFSTIDILAARLASHEKVIWMLTANLDK